MGVDRGNCFCKHNVQCLWVGIGCIWIDFALTHPKSENRSANAYLFKSKELKQHGIIHSIFNTFIDVYCIDDNDDDDES